MSLSNKLAITDVDLNGKRVLIRVPFLNPFLNLKIGWVEAYYEAVLGRLQCSSGLLEENYQQPTHRRGAPHNQVCG